MLKKCPKHLPNTSFDGYDAFRNLNKIFIFSDFSTQNLRNSPTHSHPGPQGFSPTRVQMALGKSIADFFQKKILLHVILTYQEHQKRK